MMSLKSRLVAVALLVPVLCMGSCKTSGVAATEPAMTVHYLEIVTSDVDATCSALSKVHGVSFDETIAEFGNARVAALIGGGRIGVRAPMAEHDQPIVRPYMLVEDLEVAEKAAEAAGGQFAMRDVAVPGHGKFAIYILKGTQVGLWEAPAAASK